MADEDEELGKEALNAPAQPALGRVALVHAGGSAPQTTVLGVKHREFVDLPQQMRPAIAEFRDMKMQPSLERALRRKEVLKA